MTIKDRSWTEINLDHFSYNLNELKKLLKPSQGFMQIVKADAYGHGAVQIARKAIENGAQFLGVANAEEGVLLRFQGIKHPILIMSPSLPEEIPVILEYDLIPSVSEITFLTMLNQHCSVLNKVYPIHLKIDTGMNRNGFRFDQTDNILKIIDDMNQIRIDGIFSHFAASENDLTFSLLQKERFENFLKKINRDIPYIHLGNSSALVQIPDLPGNLVRLGLLSYGVYTDESIKNKIQLKPVMTFKSRLSHIKTAEQHESIGYNRTYQVNKSTRYGIIPVGYADGYDFLLSGKGMTEINQKICPVIGKISMDMIAVDLTECQEAEIGNTVILLGGENYQTSAETITELYHGSSYELLCQIGRRAKRYFLENDRVLESAPILRRDFIPKDFSDKKLNTIIHQAIEERIQQKELATVIYHDILKYFFTDKDQDVFYRSEFNHSIKFIHSNDVSYDNYYKAETSISFNKILQNNYFIVACANNMKNLERYFLRKDTEYRWLLDENISLDENSFFIKKVMINQVELKTETKRKHDCLEFKCFSDEINPLMGQEVTFTIETVTWYPKDQHQLSIYITEITKGIHVSFSFPEDLNHVQAVPIFSGKNKFPITEFKDHQIIVRSEKNEWIFPNSGIVFVY